MKTYLQQAGKQLKPYQVIIVLNALSFLPVFMLGPISEQLYN
jgi:K+-transporting ATPase A subunit